MCVLLKMTKKQLREKEGYPDNDNYKPNQVYRDGET